MMAQKGVPHRGWRKKNITSFANRFAAAVTGAKQDPLRTVVNDTLRLCVASSPPLPSPPPRAVLCAAAPLSL